MSSNINRRSNHTNNIDVQNSNDTMQSKVEDMPLFMNIVSPSAKENSRRNIKMDNDALHINQ